VRVQTEQNRGWAIDGGGEQGISQKGKNTRHAKKKVTKRENRGLGNFRGLTKSGKDNQKKLTILRKKHAGEGAVGGKKRGGSAVNSTRDKTPWRLNIGS